jgi:DNA-binding GntR family transcriptional regulator
MDGRGVVLAQLAIPADRADRAALGMASLGQPAPEPLSEVAVRYLRDAILEGRLRARARIRQEAVARELGTSRIPVREA